jgi:uncharacterized membrane protein YphA (DoxX/SURF4 family)
MNTVQRIVTWGDTHHPKWLDIVRIGLGVFLFYKGVEFGRHPGDLQTSLDANGSWLFSLFSIQYIALINLFGGLLIAMGLITRWAAAFQLPILLGALFLTGHGNIFSMYSQFWITLSVFVLLIGFLVEGSGPWSVDAYMRTHRNA